MASDGFGVVDAAFASLCESEPLPGLVWGVVAGGGLHHWSARGQADLEAGRPVTPETRFRIASMTKMTTALAVLMLRDEGALLLDDPAQMYVPALAAVPLPTRDSRPPTVRELLNHTTGFVVDDPWADRNLGMTPAELDRLIAEGGFWARPPGVAFEYSNLGYGLLGRVITNVAGRRYQDFIAEKIFAPLGMIETTFDIFSVPPELRAAGYAREGDGWRAERLEPDGELGAMGGLATTARDYGRWTGFLISAWPPRDDPETAPAKRASVRELAISHGPPPPAWTFEDGGEKVSVASAYGFGLVNAADPELGRLLTHSGGLPGFGSHLAFSPPAGVGIFAFANRTYAPVHLASRAAAKALKAAGLWTARPPPTSAPLAAAVAAVLRAYEAGGVAEAGPLISENLLLDHSAETRDAELQRLRAALGPARLERIEPRHRLAGRFVFACEKGSLAGDMALTPEGDPRIQLLSFEAPG